MAVPGNSPVLMSWRDISENIRAKNRFAATCVNGPFRDRITCRCIWSVTKDALRRPSCQLPALYQPNFFGFLFSSSVPNDLTCLFMSVPSLLHHRPSVQTLLLQCIDHRWIFTPLHTRQVIWWYERKDKRRNRQSHQRRNQHKMQCPKCVILWYFTTKSARLQPQISDIVALRLRSIRRSLNGCMMIIILCRGCGLRIFFVTSRWKINSLLPLLVVLLIRYCFDSPNALKNPLKYFVRLSVHSVRTFDCHSTDVRVTRLNTCKTYLKADLNALREETLLSPLPFAGMKLTGSANLA